MFLKHQFFLFLPEANEPEIIKIWKKTLVNVHVTNQIVVSNESSVRNIGVNQRSLNKSQSSAGIVI